MTDSVVDASTALVILREEPGAESATRELTDGRKFMSAVNAVEVMTRLVDLGLTAANAVVSLESLQFTIVPFGVASAARATALRLETRSRGLSLGDRACLALAIELGHRVLTADRRWAELTLPVNVLLTR